MNPDVSFATHDLREALLDPDPRDPTGPPIGTTLPMGSEIAFRAQATAWLGSTLSAVTLSNADWSENYQYFKGLTDPDFAAQTAEDWTVKPWNVRAVQLTDANFGRIRAWIESAGGEIVWAGTGPDDRKSLALTTNRGEKTACSGDYIVHRGGRDDWTVHTTDRFLADHDRQPKAR